MARNTGIEGEANRALRRLIFFRALGDVCALPRSLSYSVTQFLASIEKTVFICELDAARRYRAVANTDLALAAGEPARYAGLAHNAAVERDNHFHPAPQPDDD